jgi:hypothetical protein
VVEHSLDRSLQDHPRRYVDVFRHRGVGGRGADVIEVARRYADRRYAYGHLALGALVVATSTWLPSEPWKLRWLLEACEIHRFLELDRAKDGQLVTCTELVVRAYHAAGVPIAVSPSAAGRFEASMLFEGIVEVAQGAKRYVPGEGAPSGADADADWRALQALVRARYVELTGNEPLAEAGPPTRGAPSGRAAAVPFEQQVREVVRARYRELTGEAPAAPAFRTDGMRAAAAPGGAATFIAGETWSASLVTPRYLEDSTDLDRIGRLHDAAPVAVSRAHAGTPARRRASR